MTPTSAMETAPGPGGSSSSIKAEAGQGRGGSIEDLDKPFSPLFSKGRKIDLSKSPFASQEIQYSSHIILPFRQPFF
ncbi:hypothetical protein MASR2M17_15770 [Aminivibrio sp.]